MKIWFHTFGCRVNQYETQILREKMLAGAQSRATEDFLDADVCVINTCTVTEQADNEALKLARRIAIRNPAARLIVTGCLASRDPQAILKEAPAALVVGNEGKDNLPAMLGCSAGPMTPGAAQPSISWFHVHSRAFVKIQDGCNMECAYCVIPAVRPKLSCKPYDNLRHEVENLLAQGYVEIVLCGIRLGRYMSADGAGKRVDFVSMLERLTRIPGDFRIRLSSLEITDVGDRLIAVMANSTGRLCPSLHVPLQSGSAWVLKRMQRWYSAAFYKRRINALKNVLPHVGLFTDIMVGFPGENQARFKESLDLIKEIEFSGLHVFRYSQRAKTPAARYEGQIPEKEISARASEMRRLDHDLRAAFAARAVGSRRRVVAELSGREALTEDFLTVKLEKEINQGFHNVQVLKTDGPLLWAQVSSTAQ